MLKSKKNLANMTVASGEKWIGELSNEELKEVFGSGHTFARNSNCRILPGNLLSQIAAEALQEEKDVTFFEQIKLPGHRIFTYAE
jgi:hypothetical protein